MTINPTSSSSGARQTSQAARAPEHRSEHRSEPAAPAASRPQPRVVQDGFDAAPRARALDLSGGGSPAAVSARSVDSGARGRIDAYAAGRDIGHPIDNGGGTEAHDWDGLTVRDYSGGGHSEGRRCMVVDSAAGGTHLVRNDFYKNYLEGQNHVKLGAPLEDERVENGAVVQRFERGVMRWTPERGTQVEVTQGGPVTGPVTGPVPGAGGVYDPYEVAPGATVNGRLGADWPGGAPVDETIQKMKELGVRYTCILSPDASDQTLAKLQQAGITPVVRLYHGTSPADWSAQDIQGMADQARHFAEQGVKLIQVGNEPNHAQESHPDPNQPWDWDGYERRSIDRQVEALKAVKNAVGDRAAVGIPPMAPGTPDRQDWAKGYYGSHQYFEKLVGAIGQAERADGRAYVDWVPTHTYADMPGESKLADYDWYEQTASRMLGRTLKGLSTEGGPHPSTWREGDPVGLLRDQYASMEQSAGRTNCLWLQWAPSFTGADGWEKMNVFQNDPPERTKQMLDWLREHAPH